MIQVNFEHDTLSSSLHLNTNLQFI